MYLFTWLGTSLAPLETPLLLAVAAPESAAVLKALLWPDSPRSICLLDPLFRPPFRFFIRRSARNLNSLELLRNRCNTCYKSDIKPMFEELSII
jgi:hypothetical protein